jgi:hypothetical protein
MGLPSDHQVNIRQQWDSGDHAGALAYLKSWLDGVGKDDGGNHMVTLLNMRNKALSTKSLADADAYNNYLMSWVHGVGLPISVDILTAYNGLNYLTYKDLGASDSDEPISTTPKIRAFPVMNIDSFPVDSLKSSPTFNSLPLKLTNTIINTSKQIPVAGDIIKVADSLSKGLDNSLAGIGLSGKAKDITSTIINLATGVLGFRNLLMKSDAEKNRDNLLSYYDNMDEPYFRVNYTDPDWSSVKNFEVDSSAQYDLLLNSNTVINGISGDKMIFFPNVVKKQIKAEAARKQIIEDQKNTYGPFYGIVNWFKTNPTVQDLSNNPTSKWVIGSVVLLGGLAIIYVIMED